MIVALREAKPVARKPHCCGMCDRQITPGETYSRATLKYDDQIYDWIECADCQRDLIYTEVHSWSCGCYDEGVNAETAYEWAHETVRHGKTDSEREIAQAWLTRFGCDCDECVPLSSTPATTTEETDRA